MHYIAHLFRAFHLNDDLARRPSRATRSRPSGGASCRRATWAAEGRTRWIRRAHAWVYAGGVSEAAKIAVIYYSATGNVHALAQAVAEGAEAAGAEVRLRHVEELASELLISQNQYWGRHRSEVAGRAGRDARGSRVGRRRRVRDADPVRERRRPAEAVHRPGRRALAGGQAGRQGRDVLHVVADRPRRPGVDDPRPQQHPLPLGDGDRPARLHGAARSSRPAATRTAPRFVTGHTVTGPDEGALAVARYQGRRLAAFAAVLAEARRNGAFAVERPSPEDFAGPTTVSS